jgi:hypothetical protein
VFRQISHHTTHITPLFLSHFSHWFTPPPPPPPLLTPPPAASTPSPAPRRLPGPAHQQSCGQTRLPTPPHQTHLLQPSAAAGPQLWVTVEKAGQMRQNRVSTQSRGSADLLGKRHKAFGIRHRCQDTPSHLSHTSPPNLSSTHLAMRRAARTHQPRTQAGAGALLLLLLPSAAPPQTRCPTQGSGPLLPANSAKGRGMLLGTGDFQQGEREG